MIDSQRQLILRILTGTHAGVELSLIQNEYSIGHGSDCDIVISDWPVESMQLVVTNNGTEMPAISFNDPAVTSQFGLEEPCLVGDIVVTLYDAAQKVKRLSDVAILRKLMVVPEPVAERGSIKNHWIVAATVVTLSVIVGVGLQTSGSVAATKQVDRPKAGPTTLAELLKSGKYPEITVVTQGNVTYVDGLVKNRTQLQALTTGLARLQVPGLVQRFASASDISDAIVSAIAQPGISASYVGGGKFEITGEIPETVRKRLNLEKLRSDLGGFVTAITYARPDQMISASEAAQENVQKMQGYELRIAKDGSKYFISDR